jgi:hypothetical protein
VVLLDKVIREGVIYAMLFSGDKLKLAQVELECLELLVKEMGIYFVKHLKVISFQRLTYGSMLFQSSRLFLPTHLEVTIHHNSSLRYAFWKQ